jgi:outer membrane protein assembly factor BamC
LTQLTRDTRYAVPGGPVTASSMGVRPAQAVATTAAKQVNDVRIERDGKQRWLVVNRSADAVWPIVQGFWKENGFEYVIEQQQLGLLETEWAENRAKIPQDFIRRSLGKVLDGLYSSGERDKFRTRIERNSTGGVDIFVSHRGMSEEDFVGMAGEAAQDKVEELLHDRRGQAALAAAARAFLTMLRTVSDICAPFFTQWSMRSTLTL